MMDVAYLKYLGNGPFAPHSDDNKGTPCSAFWWQNLLYINNFVKSPWKTVSYRLDCNREC